MVDLKLCDCKNCIETKKNLENDTWLHLGNGNLKNSINDYQLNTKFKPEELFNPIIQHKKYGYKPNAIWFSAGSWLYDPYNDDEELHHLNEFNNNSYKMKVFKINHINNDRIYKLHDFESIYEFNKIYNVNSLIDWQEVVNDYDAIKTTFRKPYHLENITFNNTEFNWLTTYDVETLAVFNLNAIQSDIELIEYTVYDNY